MSEQDSGRKTLTIKSRAKPGAKAPGKEESPRTRIGARARQVAHLNRGKEQQARQADRLNPEQAPAAERDTRPGPRAASRPGPRSGERPSDWSVARRPTSRPVSSKGVQPQRHSAQQYGEPVAQPPHYDAAPPEQRATRRDHDDYARPVAPQERLVRVPRVLDETETFHIFAPCPVGLEEALAAELNALGYEHVNPTRAGCHFVADWWGVQRANLYSRLATRILVRLGQAPVQREDDILELAQSIGWERWFGAEHTLRVDTSAVRSPMQSLQYCNLRAKDGICDRLRELEGERPSIDTVRPDARVHLFLSADTATMYLDTSGESLFKRGWRLDKGDAPLRENLAAGILALSDWDPAGALMDPFCGSGTILIEAAWIALGVPPGITRPFGFERLRDHDARRWQDLKEDARARILPELQAPLVGIDADPEAIESARRNAERAFLTEDTIQFELGDARDAVAPAPTGWIVTNPPYGERLDEADVAFWREWSSNLKKEFSGWQVNIITSDHDLPKHLRLKANRRTPIFNGALDCRLFNFEVVADSYRS